MQRERAPGAARSGFRGAPDYYTPSENRAYIEIINRGRSASFLRLRFISRSTSSFPLVQRRFDSRRLDAIIYRDPILENLSGRLSLADLSLESKLTFLFHRRSHEMQVLKSAHDLKDLFLTQARDIPNRG